MDARKINLEVLKTALKKENYIITGVTEDGEIVLTIIDDFDKSQLDKIFQNNITNYEKLNLIRKLMSIKGRPAKELMQVYFQKIAINSDRCKANGLRIK